MGNAIVLAAALCLFGLAGCTEDLITSGSGSGESSKEADSANGESAQSDVIVLEDGEDPLAPDEQDPVAAEPPAAAPPAPEPPASGTADSCGAGRYEFRTDSDGKFHFDARFEPDGTIRYNFTVQPNRGNWRISGDQMIFNGPFGAGNANHVSTWNITRRSSDCRVQEFRGKSAGGSNVTASRR